MARDLHHPYIPSTTVLGDTCMHEYVYALSYAHVHNVCLSISLPFSAVIQVVCCQLLRVASIETLLNSPLVLNESENHIIIRHISIMIH